MYTNYPVSLYVESEITTTSFHEYLPKWADIELLSEEKDKEVSVHQFAFPGQTLYVDGVKTNYKTDERGLIKFSATGGKHDILVRFEETNLIKISKIVSLLSILALMFYTKKYGSYPTN